MPPQSPAISDRDPHIRAAAAFHAACVEWSSRLPAALAPRGPGRLAALACMLEASAPKPGNVHPAADFPDLSHAELMAAAAAIAPALEMASIAPLGDVILNAVRRSRAVTRSNANLGIILALAPLAAVSPDAWAEVAASGSMAAACEGANRVLRGLGPDDAAAIWQAIGLSRAGGLGSAETHDLAGPPPHDILAAMRLAADHDQIARLWTDGYARLATGLVADLVAACGAGLPWHEAIVDAFLRQLAREPDSLIGRRHGPEVAADVSSRAAAVLAAPVEARGASLAE